ncbi:MAG: hypothetical protein A2270_08085 [Elusimicrobia bacterium RIFOXYA12_FULL_51_18]|nr:MAG: hypothetical protein A2270_08085 [Elusimicrobia bacterium RIFOXYA12_FULL_51_18]OGS28554.1 MAG: hypothetical protein A2218_04905 [Elusimicrobia bacterium RIFOXYA2_FULL_53_38]
MPKVLGFSFGANEIQTVCLSGTKATPCFEGRERVLFPHAMDVGDVSIWSESQLGLLLDRFSPEVIAYKLTRGAPTVKEISRVYFSIGILNLLANKRQIPISHHNSPLSHCKMGVARGTDLREHITLRIGEHSPYWNDHAKDSAIVAFCELN